MRALVDRVFPKKKICQSAGNGSRECGRNQGNNGFGGRGKHSHGRAMSVVFWVTRSGNGKERGRKAGMVVVVAFLREWS